MAITALPAAPQRSDTPAAFVTKADLFVAALAQFQSEANALQTDVNTKATTATTKAQLAVDSAAAAVTSAGDAYSNSQQSAASALESLNWATLLGGPVSGGNYSAKYYAAVAQAAATMAGNTVAFSDNLPVLKNLADATKRAFFNLSGFTTGTDRTFILPNKSGTLALTSDAVGGGGSVPAAGDVTLTATSGGAQLLTSNNFFQYVQLPNATTMLPGASVFTIQENGPYDRWIKDATGAFLGVIRAGKTVNIGLADISTSAGQWLLEGVEYAGVEAQTEFVLGTSSTGGFMYATIVDANRTFLLMSGVSGLYGIVYDASTKTFGTPTLIRSSSGLASRNYVKPVLVATDKVLVASCVNGTTAMNYVVVSLTGSSIAVGTPVVQTLIQNFGSFGDVLAVGSTFVFAYGHATASELVAVTVSGTVPTFGATHTMPTAVPAALLPLTGTTFMAFTAAGTMYSRPLTVSGGTTLTAGTTATTASIGGVWLVRALASGRFALVANNSVVTGYIISVTGVVATASAGVSLMPSLLNGPGALTAQVIGSQVVVAASETTYGACINILTDNAGVAVAGTPYVCGLTAQGQVTPLGVFGTEAWVHHWGGSTTIDDCFYRVSISGNNPVVFSTRRMVNDDIGDFGYISASPWCNASESRVLKSAKRVLTVYSPNTHSRMATASGISFVDTLPLANPVGFNSSGCKGATAAEMWNFSFPVNNAANRVMIQKVRLV